MRCVHTHDSGPYVLGALLSAEREAYEAHLPGCAACRAEVAELAVLPGLLGRVDLATAESLLPGPERRPVPGAEPDLPAALRGAPGDPEPTPAIGGGASIGGASVGGASVGGASVGGASALPLSRILTTARARRARQRRRNRARMVVAVLAAAAITVLALIGIPAITDPAPQRPSNMVLMRQADPAVGVSGWIAVEPFDGGTRVRLRCSYRGGTDSTQWVYRLVAVPRSGADEQIGSWYAGYDEEMTLTSTTALSRGDITRIELRSGTGRPLLIHDLQ